MQTDPSPSSGRIRFGDFEVDLSSHELLRSGQRMRLQEKSFLVLSVLLKSPGQVVTREAIAEALWPKEHFVDSEHGLNTAVRRLREALGDSADDARFVETLPKLGYRFIGAIETRPEPASASQPKSSDDGPPAAEAAQPSPSFVAAETPVRASRRGLLAVAATLAAAALSLVVVVLARSRSARTVAEAPPPAPRATDPDPVKEALARARYLRNMKRLAESRHFIDEALRLDPKNAEAISALALILTAEGKTEQGRDAARRAIEIDPNAWEAHRALGVIARAAGDLAGAERHFRRAAEAAPTDSKTLNRLARHLLETGRIEEAKKLIVETRRLTPDDPDVQNIWLEHALRTGDFESAIRQGESWMLIWAKQIEGEPTPTVRDMLGLAYVGARRHEDAVAQFRAIDPDDDLRIALSLAYGGRTSEARAILEAHERTDASPAGSSDPGRDGAMAMICIALGDFDRAFQHLDRQLAAGWLPGWLNCALFHPIRSDPRWASFERRLHDQFSAGEERAITPARMILLQQWPRPARAKPARS